MAPPRDPRENVISEEMVKLIFLPIKESLATTTTAINEASQQVKDLARLFSTPPGRGDIIKELSIIINNRFDDLKNELEKYNNYRTSQNKETAMLLNSSYDNMREYFTTQINLCNTQDKDFYNSIIKSISVHEADMERIIDLKLSKLNITSNDNSAVIKSIQDSIQCFDNNLKSITKDLEGKLNLTIGIIGVTFTLALIVWGILTYTFDSYKEEIDLKLKESTKITEKK